MEGWVLAGAEELVQIALVVVDVVAAAVVGIVVVVAVVLGAKNLERIICTSSSPYTESTE